MITGVDRGGGVIKYNNGAISTGVMRDENRGVIKYNNGAISTGVMRDENSGFCSTI